MNENYIYNIIDGGKYKIIVDSNSMELLIYNNIQFI